MEPCQPLFQTLTSSTAESMNCSSQRSHPVSALTPQSIEALENPHGFIGSLEIFIHEARDIQNICIYHKQDVYAKFSITSDPESAVSTKIINGGGRNPVFNHIARLNVVTIDSSLKCELWMLSRAKNYLEDQLLGFTLVPLSEVLISNGKLVNEFPLSSTDLFHSPAGFVQLSLSYTGSSPEVMAISETKDTHLNDSVYDDSTPCDYGKIEFPDLKVVNENKMMLSEYFGIPCSNLASLNGESLNSTVVDDYPDNDAGVKIVESFSTENTSLCFPYNGSSEPSRSTESPKQKTKDTEVAEGDSGSSASVPEKEYAKPFFEVNMEPEQPVVEQVIVDMYMKSMQQFTESLANMKLPMAIENISSSNSNNTSMENGNASSGKKLEVSKNASARVFYGSRAFF